MKKKPLISPNQMHFDHPDKFAVPLMMGACILISIIIYIVNQ